jgi:hypothetical protein
MDKIFVICNKQYEKDRYENMRKQLNEGNFNNIDIEYFCHIWKNEIFDNNYNNITFENLNKGEKSVFINHIEILYKIKREYNDGIFLVLESDAYVFPGMEFTLDKVNRLSEIENNWDIINIGGSCLQLFQEHGYPKSTPINFNNTKFYKENRLICIEALLWNYKSIVKFLDEYEKLKIKFNNKIHLPIDVLIDYLVEHDKLNIFWIHPCLIKQGSGSVWKSNIRE